LLEQKSAQMKADISLMTDAKKTVMDNLLQNNAPQSVWNAVDAAASKEGATASDIMSAAGSYGVDKYRQAQTAKLLEGDGSGTGDLSSSNSLIVNTILSSNKFTKDQKQYLVDAAKSGMDMTYIVKNQAKTAMSGTTATKVEAQELSLASLERLNGLMQDYYANGGKSNIFVGNMEKVIGKLGTIKDGKLREIATDIEASLQTYRNAISGTAYSNQEGKAIASIFPGIDKTEGLNTSILNSRIDGISNLIDSAYKNVLGPEVYGLINNKVSDNQDVSKLSNDDLLGTINNTIGSWGNMNNTDFFNQI
jgi:hypothetical protein